MPILSPSIAIFAVLTGSAPAQDSGESVGESNARSAIVFVDGRVLDHWGEPFVGRLRMTLNFEVDGRTHYRSKYFEPDRDGRFTFKKYLRPLPLTVPVQVLLKSAPVDDRSRGSASVAVTSPEAAAQYIGSASVRASGDEGRSRMSIGDVTLINAPEIAEVTVWSTRGRTTAKIRVEAGRSPGDDDCAPYFAGAPNLIGTPDIIGTNVPIGVPTKFYSWNRARTWSLYGWCTDGLLELEVAHKRFERETSVEVEAWELAPLNCYVDLLRHPGAEFVAVFRAEDYTAFDPIRGSNPSYVRWRVELRNLGLRPWIAEVDASGRVEPIELAGREYVVELWGNASFEEGIPMATRHVTMPFYGKLEF